MRPLNVAEVAKTFGRTLVVSSNRFMRRLNSTSWPDASVSGESSRICSTLRNTTDKRKNEVCEVYYLCLTMGFKGKFGDLQGMEKRKVLIDSLSRELAVARGVDESSDKEKNRLAPNWKASDTGLPNSVKSIPGWLVPGICVAIALLLWLIYNAILGSATDGVLEGLK